MPRSIITAGAILVPLLAAVVAMPAEGAATRTAAPAADSIVINRGVVELETGSSPGISVRVA